jgi:hypothetical protein
MQAHRKEMNMVERIRAEMAALFDSRESTEALAARLYAQHEKERGGFVAAFNARSESLIEPVFRAFQSTVTSKGLICYVDAQKGIYAPSRRASAFVTFGIGERATALRPGTGARGNYVKVLADTATRDVVVTHVRPTAQPLDLEADGESVELSKVDEAFLHRHLAKLVKVYFD